MKVEANKAEYRKRSSGRPKKAIRKTEILMVRMTSTERVLIENKAKKAGMNPSEWFRQSAKRTHVIARFSKEESAVFRMLAGLANNFNQVVHLAHASGFISLSQKCRSLATQIDELISKLNKQTEP